MATNIKYKKNTDIEYQVIGTLPFNKKAELSTTDLYMDSDIILDNIVETYNGIVEDK